MMHHITRMLSESIARFQKLIYGAKTATEICVGVSDRPNRNRRSNSTLHKQSKCAADLLSVKTIQTMLQSIMRATSWNLQKEKVKLSFDITANADTIRCFISI